MKRTWNTEKLWKLAEKWRERRKKKWQDRRDRGDVGMKENRWKSKETEGKCTRKWKTVKGKANGKKESCGRKNERNGTER